MSAENVQLATTIMGGLPLEDLGAAFEDPDRIAEMRPLAGDGISRGKPALLPSHLDPLWLDTLPDAEVTKLEDAGHYLH